jgi:Rhodanese-related sulfurtransferase
MQQFGEFVVNHWGLFIALAVILASLIGLEVKRHLRGIKDVEPVEATRLLYREEAVLLDVRNEADFKSGHIVNAAHIPLDALENRLKELEKFKGKPIIAYCGTGDSSAKACTLLRKRGFDPVYHLGGGLMAWKNADLPLERKKRG